MRGVLIRARDSVFSVASLSARAWLLSGKPARAVAGGFVAAGARVRLLRICRLVLDAGVMAKRGGGFVVR